jgi:CPA2 family monovalent cation:H+ antiporter-2
MLLGQQPVAALAIGAALALSSTAIVMPLLAERKRQHSRAGRATFSVLLFQDLAVAPILITLALMVGATGRSVLRLLLALAPAVIGLALIVLFGRLAAADAALGRQGQERGAVHGRLPAGGHRLGPGQRAVGPVDGAGRLRRRDLLLAETEYRHEIEVKIEPFKGLLLGLFFVSVGIRLDLSLLVASPALVLGVAIGLTWAEAA